MKVRSAAVILAASLLLAPPSIAGETSDDDPKPRNVTLRAAPAGPVVPSLLLVNNPSAWLVDPAENKQFNDRRGIAGCTIETPDHNDNDVVDGADVLDEALDTGCITSWHGRNDDSCTDGSDVLVAEVDGLSEIYPVTYWLVQRNGTLAQTGICDMNLTESEELGFVYQ